MMDDLISRQAAIKAIKDLQDCHNGFSDTYDKACIIGVIEEVPSAQSDIIRCKDCKYYEIYQLTKDGAEDRRYKPSFCAVFERKRKPDWFCAYGCEDKWRKKGE